MLTLQFSKIPGAHEAKHAYPSCSKGLKRGAIYLDLAIRRSLPLATLGEDLRRGQTKVGVALLGEKKEPLLNLFRASVSVRLSPRTVSVRSPR